MNNKKYKKKIIKKIIVFVKKIKIRLLLELYYLITWKKFLKINIHKLLYIK